MRLAQTVGGGFVQLWIPACVRRRSLTGSPWFGNIVQSQLPPLGGDATIPVTFLADVRRVGSSCGLFVVHIAQEEYDVPTADPSDRARRAVCQCSPGAFWDGFHAISIVVFV